MEREGRICHQFLTMILLVVNSTISCSSDTIANKSDEVRILITFDSQDGITRSPDYKISDISLMIFEDDGLAEMNLQVAAESDEVEVNLIQGRTYDFYVCMNFGYHVFADHISEMDELSFHLSHPEDIIANMPAFGYAQDITITGDEKITIMMERLWSVIDVVLDRERLDNDININVTGIRICKSPKSAYVFNPGKASSEYFDAGYSQAGDNVSLYMLEDSSGEAYVEIDMDYLSYTYYNEGGPLKYRTHISKDGMPCEIERNSRYTMRIMPVGDGLSGEGWNVDKRWLKEFGPSRFESFPESYIRGNIGDTLHLWCDFSPPHAPFDIGIEELEEDKAMGIYDYIIDEDGHGVRLILKNPGTGIVYMEAGHPINEAAMWIIEVNLPQASEVLGSI